MLKTISALALASASIAAPAVAQDVTAPATAAVAAPVAPVGGTLPSSGLAGAYIIGGLAVVGVGAVAILASDDDDDSAVTSTPGS